MDVFHTNKVGTDGYVPYKQNGDWWMCSKLTKWRLMDVLQSVD